MGYDRGSFPFDFEPNGIQFGSKSKEKLSPRSYPIQFERNWKYRFLSVPRHLCSRIYVPNLATKDEKYNGNFFFRYFE